MLSSSLLRQRLGICGKCATGIPLWQLGNWSRWDAADGLRKKRFFSQGNLCKLVSCLWITEHRAAKLGLLHGRGLSLTSRRIINSWDHRDEVGRHPCASRTSHLGRCCYSVQPKIILKALGKGNLRERESHLQKILQVVNMKPVVHHSSSAES